MLFPQPTELTVEEPMTPIDGECAKCGEATASSYTLVDFRGWLRVTKCRSCLNVASSERIQAPAQSGSVG